MFIRLSLFGASAKLYRSKKKVQFSVNALHVHSMDLLSQYESSEDNETCGCEDTLGEEKVLKENQPRTV